MALTQVSDVIVPEIFNPYVQQQTEIKSNLIASGALVRESVLDGFLAGGGLTFQVPSWKDIGDDADNVTTDEARGVNDATPLKLGTAKEIAVRLSRNQLWEAADLAGDLAGSDPMVAIANRVADYRQRKLQDAFIATITGVFADNAAAPSGSEHTQNDMTYDVSGASYSAGVTDFSAEAFIDARLTMGDSMGDLGLVMVHSVVYAKMQKNNLIDFIPDSQGVVNIPTFHGLRVIVDDKMPKSGSVYNTWIFGAGAVRLGVGAPKIPTEVQRSIISGNGGGSEILAHRWENCIHPVGHKYAGTAASGGPSNATSSNNLANAGSWQRVYTERKQVKIARLITREA